MLFIRTSPRVFVYFLPIIITDSDVLFRSIGLKFSMMCVHIMDCTIVMGITKKIRGYMDYIYIY